MTALTPIDYTGRDDRVRAAFHNAGVDALIVSSLDNIRWLTGFTGSSGVAAVLPDRVVFVTDGRYRERAADEFAASGADVDLLVGFTKAEQLDLLVAAVSGIDRVGGESAVLSFDEWSAMSNDVRGLTPTVGIVEAARRVKGDGEIARMAAAARAADLALAEVAPGLAGMTERDVRTELEYRMRRHGADGAGYDTIVASGPTNAARPHHEPGGRTIVEGDTVIIDVGGLVDGYRSDMTRSYVIGEPTDEQRERYELLLDVQRAGVAAVGAGVPCREVDAVCRDRLTDAGYGDWYLHGTGHGVGLAIHESPFHNTVSDEMLGAGEVVTVEPGLYRVGFGGFRIEDLVVVTESGCRPLTNTPKDNTCPPSPPMI